MGAVKKQHKKNWPRIASIKTRQSARNREIYRQYVEDHKRQMVLADEHGLSREAISQIVRAVDREIREDLATDVGAIKRRHTQRLEKLYRESMAAWEHSKENFKKYTRVNKRATGKETTVTIERQCGDARFLETAMKALADIRKIWGADAPIKQDVELNGTIGVSGVVVVLNESEDWYGRRPDARTIEADHHAADGIAASAGSADESGAVQSGGVRPTLGQDDSGPAGGS